MTAIHHTTEMKEFGNCLICGKPILYFWHDKEEKNGFSESYREKKDGVIHHACGGGKSLAALNEERKVSASKKRYVLPTIYRGQQVFKVCWSKSISEAARMLETTPHNVNKYAHVNENGTAFDGVNAYFDGGLLFRKEHELLRQEMPLKTLEALINKHL